MDNPETPTAFFWRRLHSLMGFGLVLFIIFHLMTNSQAALFIGDDGEGFIKEVNFIHSLPYLPVIEVLILLVPFAIHGLWGIKYLWTAKSNSFGSDGTKPALQRYARNHLYTWQRITSWILLVGVIAHVVDMRFLDYPASTEVGSKTVYVKKVSVDNGLYTLAERLGVLLFNAEQIQQEQDEVAQLALIENPSTPDELLYNQDVSQQRKWIETLTEEPLGPGEIITVSPSFGTAELLVVRNTFKSPLMIGLYSGFVIAAVFHAFNGLWTFLITWGVILTERSQRYMQAFSVLLMVVVGMLGLSAAWLTYWVNLRY